MTAVHRVAQDFRGLYSNGYAEKDDRFLFQENSDKHRHFDPWKIKFVFTGAKAMYKLIHVD